MSTFLKKKGWGIKDITKWRESIKMPNPIFLDAMWDDMLGSAYEGVYNAVREVIAKLNG